MNDVKLTLVAFALGMFSIAADADTGHLTAIAYGGDLKLLCNADSKSPEHAECFAFVGAVLEVVYNQSIYGFKTCIPLRTTVDKAMTLTREWQETHLETDLKPASYVVAEALQHEFPCKQ